MGRGGAAGSGAILGCEGIGYVRGRKTAEAHVDERTGDDASPVFTTFISSLTESPS